MDDVLGIDIDNALVKEMLTWNFTEVIFLIKEFLKNLDEEEVNLALKYTRESVSASAQVQSDMSKELEGRCLGVMGLACLLLCTSWFVTFLNKSEELMMKAELADLGIDFLEEEDG